jgi:hypothetical protein
VNRMVVHQSVVHPRDPLELTQLLPGTGWDSLGLHVGATEEVEHWWSGGTGERNLARLVDLLLQTRVTVLDVGRVRLDGTLPPHVPVALGGDDSQGLLADDPVPRLRRLHTLVDEMLEHPRARARRLGS